MSSLAVRGWVSIGYTITMGESEYLEKKKKMQSKNARIPEKKKICGKERNP